MPTPLGQSLIKGYCDIDPELVLPRVRSNIERSCELIARGKIDFNTIVAHALAIFKDKFNFFKLSIGTLEKLMNIMRITQNPGANKELLLTAKVPRGIDDSDALNFCIRCFRGQLCIQYTKKGWGIKCNNSKCNFRIGFLPGAGHVTTHRDKCDECQSVKIEAMYKSNSPFPAGQLSRTGCILCDPVLKSTIVNQFFRNQRVKTQQEMEDDKRALEERKRLKEEKRRKREEEEKANPAAAAAKAKAGTTGEKKQKKKQKGCNIMSLEDKMNAFMAKKMG